MEEDKNQSEKPKNLWKKIKKFFLVSISILIILAVAILIYFAYRLSKEDLFGWRLNFSLNKIGTRDYVGFAPTIAFLYPDTFEIDLDPDNKFGKAYLAGMKLKTDDRTGCDIRTNGPELDFSKSADELAREIVGPIQEKASDMKVLEKDKTTIGGQKAFKVSFSFLDPIGARIRLDQLFTKGKDGTRFMIICGAGEYQFSFFQKDFNIFYDSINFEGKITDFDKNAPWYQKLWRKIGLWK